MLARRAPIIDLDEWAESQFASLCAEAGVVRNKSIQDRTGWDYLVEFAAMPIPGLPIDLQPLGPSARVQIKSKRKTPPNTRLKMTNALRFAKSTEPCFIVLFVDGQGESSPKVYARHFWEPLIAAALERARSADEPGRPALHKQMLTVGFTDADEHSDDLLSWMRAEIVAVGGLYAEKKALLTQTVGMEGGGIRGTISFEEIDWAQLVDHQLGLTDDFPIANVAIHQRRFGVDAPMIALKPDTASMRVKPRPCRIRVRGVERSEVWLEGEMLAPSFPDLPAEYFRYRIRADILDLIWAPNDLKAQAAKATATPDDQLSIEAMAIRLTLVRMLGRGPIDVQVRARGRILLGLDCKIDMGDWPAWADRMADAVKVLQTVTSGDPPPGLTLSIRDIEMAWPAIVDLSALVEGADLTLRAELANRAPVQLEGTSLWNWGWTEIGDWTFMAVVRRPIERLQDDGARIEVVCGDPEIEEGFVRPQSDTDRFNDLIETYRRCVKRAGPGALEVFEGDFRAMTQAFGKCADDACPGQA